MRLVKRPVYSVTRLPKHFAFDMESEHISVPAVGDDAVAFFGVGYGDGADRGSVPEGFGFGFVVVHGVVGGLDADAG